MKPIITLSFLFLILSCASQKVVDTVSTIEYNAITRGSSKNILVTNKTLVYKTNKEQKEITISSDERNELLKLINEINLEEIKNLKSPTNKRAFDGALHASIKIRKDGKEFQSSNFDDGYPPKELKELVELLESLVK